MKLFKIINSKLNQSGRGQGSTDGEKKLKVFGVSFIPVLVVRLTSYPDEFFFFPFGGMWTAFVPQSC